jgi:hypothetical protein
MREIPDFTNPRWHARRPDYELFISILNGRGRRMPSFADSFNEGEARKLVAHIRSFAAVKPNRDGVRSTMDFDRRFQRLQEEWQDLRRQYRELSPLPRQGGRTLP